MIEKATSGDIELNGKETLAKAAKAIQKRKKTREELLKRAAELKAQAEAYRRTDPSKARLLEHKSIMLQDEAYRMKKESEKPLSYRQLVESNLSAITALAKD